MTTLAELERRIRQLESKQANMNRVGKVTALLPEKGMVRVEFGDRSELVSYELPVVVKQTLKNKDSYMPDIGEHVTCMFLGNGVEQGFVLGAIYSDADTAANTDPNKRGVTFEDGTEVYYDRVANKLNIIVAGNGLVEVTCKEATINADTSVLVDTPQATFTGAVTVQGLFTYQAGMNGSGGSGATLNGDFRVVGSAFQHNSKNVGSTHTHTGVTPGSGNTGTPP